MTDTIANIPLTVGEFLLIQRKRKHWSKAKLARKASITVYHLNLIEGGDVRFVTVAVLVNVCQALGYMPEIKFVARPAPEA